MDIKTTLKTKVIDLLEQKVGKSLLVGTKLNKDFFSDLNSKTGISSIKKVSLMMNDKNKAGELKYDVIGNELFLEMPQNLYEQVELVVQYVFDEIEYIHSELKVLHAQFMYNRVAKILDAEKMLISGNVEELELKLKRSSLGESIEEIKQDVERIITEIYNYPEKPKKILKEAGSSDNIIKNEQSARYYIYSLLKATQLHVVISMLLDEKDRALYYMEDMINFLKNISEDKLNCMEEMNDKKDYYWVRQYYLDLQSLEYAYKELQQYNKIVTLEVEGIK